MEVGECYRDPVGPGRQGGVLGEWQKLTTRHSHLVTAQAIPVWTQRARINHIRG